MTRLLSGIVLIALTVSAVWLAPAWLFFASAELLVILACHELSTLARASRLPFPTLVATLAAMLVCAAVSRVAVNGTSVPLDVALFTSVIVVGAVALGHWNGEANALSMAAVAMMPSLYLGLPIGALAALRNQAGPEVLFLLMLTVMVSDSAQYYAGRAFGRRKLAPAISPKKTVEGAIGGFVFGAAVLGAVGAWWLPTVPLSLRLLLGATLVALGIAGDLFESMLKRSAGVKDSSSLIPGHGGVLDRIDALLFAAPIFYVVVTYAR